MRVFEQLWTDLRFGARNLIRNPGFAAIAVLSMALGIGATVAMYSVIHAVILDPFPYKDVDHLTSILTYSPAGRGGRTYYSIDQFLDFRERSTIFQGVVASTISDVTWTGGGEPRRLRGNHCTSDTFQVMGVPPMLGRVSSAADDATDAEPVAVLGHRFWMREFGGDAGVLGRKLRLNDKVRTVIGVMPPRFMWRGADVYLPIVFRRGENPDGIRGVHVLGRLKDGIAPAQVEADLRPIITEIKQREPAAIPDNWQVRLLTFKESFPSDIRKELWMLFAAVGLLLLISCVNVSNLLFTRASARAAEIAIRTSMGATGGRIVRQLLAESLLIASVGGALGIAMAYAGLKGILAMVPPNTIPDEAEIALNLPVLLFSLAVSAGAALIAGLAPALHVARLGQGSSRLVRSTRGSIGGGRKQRLVRGALVASEVALSLVLLLGASLMLRTLVGVSTSNPGFQPARILTLRIPRNQNRYPETAAWQVFLQQVLDRLETTPTIRAAGINTWMHPMGNSRMPILVDGDTQADSRPVVVHQVNEQYTVALGIKVLSGRMFSKSDITRRARLTVVNQTFAKRYAPDGRILGRVVRSALPPNRLPPELRNAAFEIIGVTEDRLNDIEQNRVLPEMYLPHTLAGGAGYLLIAGDLPPESMAGTVRQVVYSVDRDQPVMEVRSMESLLQDYVYARPRFNLLLLGVFAGLGMVLAICGIYGVVSHAVAQQTQEIGVRIALGASFSQMMRMVLFSGARIVGAGVAVGLVAGLASARLLASKISGLAAPDRLSIAAVVVALFAVGLLACLVPALRAARIHPAVALRNE